MSESENGSSSENLPSNSAANPAAERLLPGSASADIETWMGLSALTPQESAEDTRVVENLRPSHFAEYVGQESVKENLLIACKAAQKRGQALDHVLLHGPPGLGKTSLARIVSSQLGVGFKATSGPVIERPGDLAAILTSLQAKDVLFIDEIHRLPRVVEEILYPGMEDFELDILVGQGPSARSVKIELKPFTLVGATTRTGLLTSPLRDRFGMSFRLNFYAPQELKLIIQRSAQILSVKIDELAALEIARRARGTPRIANRILKRVRDFVEQTSPGVIGIEAAKAALKLLDIDERGLDQMDRMILTTIIDKFSGGPVGVETIAVAVGEEKNTLEDVYEPFLVQEGLLARTKRGREATTSAYQHLGRSVPNNRQGALF